MIGIYIAGVGGCINVPRKKWHFTAAMDTNHGLRWMHTVDTIEITNNSIGNEIRDPIRSQCLLGLYNINVTRNDHLTHCSRVELASVSYAAVQQIATFYKHTISKFVLNSSGRAGRLSCCARSVLTRSCGSLVMLCAFSPNKVVRVACHVVCVQS